MKRLFKRFDQETGIATDIMLNGEDKYITEYHMGVKTFTKKDKISQVSSAFNEWLNHLWDKVGPTTKQGSVKSRVSIPGSRYPFHDRINKFMVTKWVKKYIKQKKS